MTERVDVPRNIGSTLNKVFRRIRLDIVKRLSRLVMHR